MDKAAIVLRADPPLCRKGLVKSLLYARPSPLDMAPEDGEFDGCETMPHAFFHPSPSAPSLSLPWQKAFAALGSDFYTELRPTPCHPHWVGTSHSVAQLLGLPEGVASK